MKSTRVDGGPERAVVVGLITDRAVAGAVAARWDGAMFPSRYANLVGAWAVDHYRRYGRPPGREIGDYYAKWAENGADKSDAAAVASFLAGLSDEYERNGHAPPPAYVLDAARDVFARERLRKTADEITARLEAGEVAKAEAAVAAYRPPEVGSEAGVRVFMEDDAMFAAFAEPNESLVEYPGALGNFFAHALTRDGLVAFMGKEKVGKSYWLMDLAWRAATQSRRVAFFEVGDMSKNQVMRRFGVRAARRPWRGDPVHPVRYPREMSPGNPPEVAYTEKTFPDDLTEDDLARALARVRRTYGGEDELDTLRLSAHPNSSVSVAGIEEILHAWKRDGWVPDVVVIDYADILAPLDGRAETRDQINATWKAMRALSQRWHALVVTATQTNADSYRADTLDRANFSEDKRKYAHVTGTVGINQTADEKAAGLYRLNWIVLRELEFSEEKCVWAAACLALGCPAACSTF